MFEAAILLGILFLLFFIGVPVAFALGVTAVAGILLFLTPGQLAQLVSVAYSQSTSSSLMVAPLFVMMAEFITNAGMAKDIYDVLSRWLRRIAGSLAISNVLACSVFAALCGSAPVTAATIGKISIPEMTRIGYKPSFSIGVTAVAGTIGILIPPSMALIVFGIITETSISRLFIGGIIPGLLLAFLLCVYIFLRVKYWPASTSTKSNEYITVKDVNSDESENQVVITQDDSSFKKDFLIVLPLLLLIVVILSLMYLGFVTPTEAGGVGAIGALIIVMITRRPKLDYFKSVFLESAKTSSMIIFLIICGMGFAFTLSALGIPHELSRAILDISTNKWVILIFVYILWIILGCMLDPMGMIVITMPFLFPALVALGFDPIWIGVVSTITVCIGMVTPPIGLNLFILKGITGRKFQEVVSGTVPFLFILLLMLLILTIFPDIILFLPGTM